MGCFKVSLTTVISELLFKKKFLEINFTMCNLYNLIYMTFYTAYEPFGVQKCFRMIMSEIEQEVQGLLAFAFSVATVNDEHRG